MSGGVGSKFRTGHGEDTLEHEKHRVHDSAAQDSIDRLVAQFRLTNSDEDDEEDEEDELEPGAVKPKVPFVEWPWFNSMMGLVIMVNAIFIGLEADAIVTSGTVTPWYQIANLRSFNFRCE